MKISAWGGLGGSSGSGNHLEKGSRCSWPCSSPVCVVAGHTTWAFGTPPSMVRACTMMRRGPLPEGGCTPGPSGAKYQGGFFEGWTFRSVSSSSPSGRYGPPAGLRFPRFRRRDARRAMMTASRSFKVRRLLEAPWTHPRLVNVRQRVLTGRATCPPSGGSQPPRLRMLPDSPRRFPSRTRWRLTVSQALPTR